MELESDLVGLRLLANAGICPTEAVKFWKRRCEAEAEDASHALHGLHSTGVRMHSSGPRIGCCAIGDREDASSRKSSLKHRRL